VGVLHHLPDPRRAFNLWRVSAWGLNARFFYGELGRWEIKLMQQAIKLLQGDQKVIIATVFSWGVSCLPPSRKTTG